MSATEVVLDRPAVVTQLFGYAADWQDRQLEPGRYPVRLVTIGHQQLYPPAVPGDISGRPYWAVADVPATVVANWHGAGPRPTHLTHQVQRYAYDAVPGKAAAWGRWADEPATVASHPVAHFA